MTAGMADPAPVAQTFLVDDIIRGFARIDGIITLVDAKHVERHLDEEKPEGVVNEAVAQVAFADRLLLNKIDLVSEEELTRIEARLRSVNQFAPIQRSKQSKVSIECVLDIHGFDLQRALKKVPGKGSPTSATPCSSSPTTTTTPLRALHHQHGLIYLFLLRLQFRR